MGKVSLFLRHTLVTSRERHVLRKTYAYLRALWRWAVWFVVVSIAMLFVTWGGLAWMRAAGYEVNFSRSVPIGLYAVTQDSLYRGQMVAVCLPTELATFGRMRGYLKTGECEDSSAPVLKRIVAMQGDTVELRRDEVLVNGHPVINSGRQTHDNNGREIPQIGDGIYPVGPGELWIMGTDPTSWDGRYWGSVQTVNVLATAQMVWVAAPSGVLR